MVYTRFMGWQPKPRFYKPKNRSGYWYFNHDGRRYRAYSEADIWKKYSEVFKDNIAVPETMVVSEAGALWLRHRGHPPKSWPWQMLREWMSWSGTLRIDRLPSDHLERFVRHLESLDRARETVRKELRFAFRVLCWCRDEGWIDSVPRKPKTKAPIQRPKDYDLKDLQEKVALLPDRARRIARFMIETGCRPSEARLLKWEEVRLDDRICEITHHKTGHSTGHPRIIALTDNAVDILCGIPKEDRKSKYVFLSRTLKPYTRGGLRSSLKRYGLGHVYGFRHTWAQAQLEADVPTHIIVAQLGHTTQEMLKIYAQVRADQLRDAIPSLRSPLPAERDERHPRKTKKSASASRRKTRKRNPRKSATGRSLQAERREASHRESTARRRTA